MKTSTPASVEDHVRRTLLAVATASYPEGRDRPLPSRAGTRLWGRTVGIVALGLATAGSLAAWNALDAGEIDRVPIEAAIQQGSLQRHQWWLIPSADLDRTDLCGEPMPGVELVSGDMNKPGLEWDTGGVAYGEPTSGDRCIPGIGTVDEAAWLRDPSLYDGGFTRLGDDDDTDSPWGGYFAAHPSVVSIELRPDTGSVVTVPTVAIDGRQSGPRYAAAALSAEVCTVQVTLITASGDQLRAGAEPTELC